jgi:hypothetical protein
MAAAERPDTRWRQVTTTVVVVLALHQGVVPLVARGVFDRDQRFAPAMWLPSPWWWLACLAIIVVAAGLVLALDPEGDGPEAPPQGRPDETAALYDVASAVVFLAGIYNGVAPFVSRLVFDGDLFLAFTLRLRSPWWWIASITVVLVAGALLALIDEAKQRHLRASSRTD